MSKRYFEYRQLESIPIGEKHKPAGTLGSHHFVIESKSSAGIFVVGVSSKGDSNRLFLPPGWTLIYNQGLIRKICPVDQINSSLLREFRLRKWSSDRIVRSDDPIQLSYPDSSYLLGQNWGFISEEDAVPRPFRSGLLSDNKLYVSGEVAIEFIERGNPLDGYVRRLNRLIIRSAVSDDRVVYLLQSWDRSKNRLVPQTIGDLFNNAECISSWVILGEKFPGISRERLERFLQKFPPESSLEEILSELKSFPVEVIVEICGDLPGKVFHKINALVYKDQCHFQDQTNAFVIPDCIVPASELDLENHIVLQGVRKQYWR